MLLSRLIASAARHRPRSAALKCGTTVINYDELDRASRQVARAFQLRGLSPSGRVAILARPCHWFAVVEVGTIVAGGIVVPVFPRFSRADIAHVVAETNPTILVYSREFASIAKELDAPGLRARLSFDEGDRDPWITETLAQTDPAPGVHEGNLDDVALIIHTGGTSGRPKGVTHAHRNWTWFVWETPQQQQGWTPDGHVHVSWNIHHASGQMNLWRSFFNGWRVTLTPMLGPTELVDFMRRDGTTHGYLVGANFKDVVDVLVSTGAALPDLRQVTHGGAPTNPETLQSARAVFPHAHLFEGYGMTEAGRVTVLDVIQGALAPNRRERLFSVGTPPGHVELRLVDDAARDVRAGQIGEIVLRSDGLSPGYWKASAETAQAYVNGWFHTGDLGRMDEDGYLYIMDRKKDMVLVGATNVYTAEVENVLAQHPRVRECAVIGIPRRGEGEEILAIIVAQAGATIGLDDIRSYAREWLADYKLPTRLDIRTDLPRTGVGKTDKKALRAKYWGDRERQVN